MHINSGETVSVCNIILSTQNFQMELTKSSLTARLVFSYRRLSKKTSRVWTETPYSVKKKRIRRIEINGTVRYKGS